MPKANFMLTQKSVVLHHCYTLLKTKISALRCTNVHEINTETLTSCFFLVKLCSRIWILEHSLRICIWMQILKFYRTRQKLIRKCIIKYTNYSCCNYWSFCAALIIKILNEIIDNKQLHFLYNLFWHKLPKQNDKID